MKISIITITYNSEKTVKDTLESVLQQSYRPLQYIMVDGLSTDRTIEIIKEYEPRFLDQGIEFSFKSEKDKGISDAFNKGIARADGDLIGIINSDDMLCDEALQVLAKNYNEEISVYYGDCIIFKDENSDKYVGKPKTDLERLKWTMGLYHPACFVRHQAYEKYGVFSNDLKYCMDRELLLRFYINGCVFKYIETPLAYYREGGVNQTNYRKNLKEGTKISIDYGMNPVKAYTLMIWKYLKQLIWRVVQIIGAEKLIHKKV